MLAFSDEGVYQRRLDVFCGRPRVAAIHVHRSELYVVGSWETSLQIRSVNIAPDGQTSGTFVATFDQATLVLDRGTSFAGTGVDVSDVLVNDSGDIFVGGDLRTGTITVGTVTLPPPPETNVSWPFAFSLNAALEPRWVRTWAAGETELYRPTQAAISPDGTVHLIFPTTQSLDLGTGGIVAPHSGVLMAVSPDDGEVVRRTTLDPEMLPEDFGATPDGRITLGFNTTGPLDLGGGGIASGGSSDVFVFELEARTLEYVWGRALGGADRDGEVRVLGIPDGSAVVAGVYRGSLSWPEDGFSGEAVVATGDGLVVRLSPDYE